VRLPATRNIYLVGFMGAGKTSVAAALARLTGAAAIDLDGLVETAADLPVVEIFRRHGEPHFRLLELQCLREVAGRGGQVVALGGGTFSQPEAAALVQGSGVAVWLDCPLDELVRRCVSLHAPRPLARSEADFRALYAARLPHYRLAPFRVDTGGRTIAAVAAEIVEILNWKGLLDPDV
jgi:shikimate kinase